MFTILRINSVVLDSYKIRLDRGICNSYIRRVGNELRYLVIPILIKSYHRLVDYQQHGIPLEFPLRLLLVSPPRGTHYLRESKYLICLGKLVSI